MIKRYGPRDETRRNHFIAVRLNDEEQRMLDTICEVLKENRSAYVRRRALTVRFGPPAFQMAFDEATAKQIAGQLGKIFSNLNQISRKLDSNIENELRMKDAIGNSLSDIATTLRHLRGMEDYRGDSEASCQS